MPDTKPYKVRANFAVHVDEKTVHVGGDICELDEHQALRHFHKLEELSAKEAAEFRKANADPAA